MHREEEIKTIQRNSDMVYRLAFSQMRSRHDADDVYQEVFLRYLRRKPQFASLEHEKAWFLRVTLNCSKTHFKTYFSPRFTELDENIEAQGVAQEDLRAALDKLPKADRAVLHLFYYEDLPVAEIAEILHRKPGSVRMLLTRARRKLKDILEKEHYV